MLPKRFPDRDEIAAVRADADALEPGGTDESKTFRLAGRVLARREMGKITFLDLVGLAGVSQPISITRSSAWSGAAHSIDSVAAVGLGAAAAFDGGQALLPRRRPVDA